MASAGRNVVVVGVSLSLIVFISFTDIIAGNDAPNTHVRYLSYPDFQTFIEDSHVRIVYFKRRGANAFSMHVIRHQMRSLYTVEVRFKPDMPLSSFHFVEPLNVKSFLREYDKAAQVLATYGIQLGLVDCSSAPPGISRCPDDETAERFAFGFRESVQKIALPLETLYDVNSIVSSALHLALIHNVPIVQQQSERKELEDHCKLNCNIIYTFQRVLGTYEHRVFMEAAHRFFDRYVFAMTTTESATRGLSTIDSEGEPSTILEEPAVWVILCQHVIDKTQECLHTNYRNPMELENFIIFLEHLELPEWVELTDVKSTTNDVYDSHNLHSVFLVYDVGVKQKVLELAPELGLRFKGIAGIVVMNVNNFTPDDLRQIGFQPENLKPPSIGFKAHGQAKVAVINEYDNAYQFVVEQLKYLFGSQDLQQNAFELVEELDELQQDDEVALAVQSAGYNHEHSILPAVTDKNFDDFVKSKLLAVVLFYLHWDPISQIALNVLSEAAEVLHSSNSVELGRVDCFDWTDVCVQENITAYPTIKVFRRSSRMNYQLQVLEFEALLTSLKLFGQDNPVSLKEVEELNSFIQGEITLLPNEKPVVLPSLLLGKHTTHDSVGSVFDEIGQELHGLVRMGICEETICNRITRKFNLDFPFAILFKPNDVFENYVVMVDAISVNSLRRFIEESCLEVFPQLTEHNFAAYRKEDKPLGILFTPSRRHQEAYTSIGRIAIANKSVRFGWMDLFDNTTQAVKTVLSPGTSHDELTLVLVDYKKAFVYVYCGVAWDRTSLQHWIDAILNGVTKPSKTLPSGDWKPRLPGFDYLKFIDQDQVREEEDKYIMDAALDDFEELHQSRLFRLPGSSDRRLRLKPRDEVETQHQHIEL